MESGQSDIRNKILAPVFKKLGIIEQWGNGLRIISEELKKYPEIEFSRTQSGMSFRASFLRTNYNEEQENKGEKTDSANDYDRLEFEEQKILLYLLDNTKITRREAIKLLEFGETKTLEKLENGNHTEQVAVFKSGKASNINVIKLHLCTMICNSRIAN